jgi:hypothetical protein
MEPCCSRTLIKSGKETSLVTSDWCIFVTKRKKPTVSSSRHHTQAKQKLTLVNLTSHMYDVIITTWYTFVFDVNPHN